MKPTHDTAHVAEGLGFLIAQYKGQPELEGLVEAFLEAVQELEEAVWSIVASQQVTRVIAPGPPDQALLQLADLVGCPVGGLSGPELAFLLRLWRMARRSLGRSEDLIRILATAFPGLYTYEEFWPEAFRAVVYQVPDVNVLPGIAQALTIARPPEVAGVLAWGNWDLTSTFYFGDASAGGAPASDFEDSISRTYGTGFLSGIEV